MTEMQKAILQKNINEMNRILEFPILYDRMHIIITLDRARQEINYAMFNRVEIDSKFFHSLEDEDKEIALITNSLSVTIHGMSTFLVEKETFKSIRDIIDRLYAVMRPVLGHNIKINRKKIECINKAIAELSKLKCICDQCEKHSQEKSDLIKNAVELIKEYKGFVEGSVRQEAVNHPSYKSTLGNDIILAKYKELNSFRAVARALNCSPKTVKRRLLMMGEIKE